MITIKTIYTGDLQTIATHVRSGRTLVTDAPVDNQGKGENFSPTDLLAASLGSCTMTIIGIAARNHNFSVDGTRMEITKIMAENPRRVAEVVIDYFFPPNSFSDREKAIIENAARTCPVARSLHTDLKQTLRFNY